MTVNNSDGQVMTAIIDFDEDTEKTIELAEKLASSISKELEEAYENMIADTDN